VTPSTRTIAALLLVIQGWMAASGATTGVGCLRFWSCLDPAGAQSAEHVCECCRQDESPEAPSGPISDDQQRNQPCCVNLSDAGNAPQRESPSGELARLLNLAFVVCLVSDSPRQPTHDLRAPTWTPPPDPGLNGIPAGPRTTQLLI
jgi:hypothetical protein